MISSRTSSYLAFTTRGSKITSLGKFLKHNSVKSLYEARKIESKLEQCKLLGIVTPEGLVDINAVKKGGRSHKISDCDYCAHSHDKSNCPAYGKTCNKCGMKNHFAKKCMQNNSDSKSCNRPRSKGDCDQKCKSCGKFKKEFHSVEMDSDDCDGCDKGNQMENSTELFSIIKSMVDSL